MLNNFDAAVIAIAALLCLRLIYRRVHRNNHEPAVFIFTKGVSSDPDLYCTVCLKDIVAGDRCRRLPKCGHCFHVDCIDTWINGYSSTCPICRCEVIHRLIRRKDGEDDSLTNLIFFLSICRKILRQVGNSLCNEITAAICSNL
ncbi:RING-H2 finger protein ATL8-like [Impatiens glandulifera]|uniref:RING-H2 finger protein ATL8-like n=1 Tax=Impatiens glandulifera TaxID=253017 RepID=UPI001FB1497F|nr:RING-H2 finger protein ATL8-like [Impatiens glandulifera]